MEKYQRTLEPMNGPVQRLPASSHGPVNDSSMPTTIVTSAFTDRTERLAVTPVDLTVDIRVGLFGSLRSTLSRHRHRMDDWDIVAFSIALPTTGR
jgi:hypothetical protein